MLSPLHNDRLALKLESADFVNNSRASSQLLAFLERYHYFSQSYGSILEFISDLNIENKVLNQPIILFIIDCSPKIIPSG